MPLAQDDDTKPRIFYGAAASTIAIREQMLENLKKASQEKNGSNSLKANIRAQNDPEFQLKDSNQIQARNLTIYDILKHK